MCLEMTMLSNRMIDYSFINQGKTRIPGVNDFEDMEATDVSDAAGCWLLLHHACISLFLNRIKKKFLQSYTHFASFQVESPAAAA